MATRGSKLGRAFLVVAIVCGALAATSGALFGVMYGNALTAQSEAFEELSNAQYLADIAEEEWISAQSLADECYAAWWCGVGTYVALAGNATDASGVYSAFLDELSRAESVVVSAIDAVEMSQTRLIGFTSSLGVAAVIAAVLSIVLWRRTLGPSAAVPSEGGIATAQATQPAAPSAAPGKALPALWTCKMCQKENSSGLFCLNCGNKRDGAPS
jgi:hypothetical protein